MMIETNQITGDGHPWFAVQTRTTHEKRVASLLDYQRYEYFLPLYTARRRWSDRIKQVELPSGAWPYTKAENTRIADNPIAMPLASHEWSWSERQTTDDRRPLSDSFRSSSST